MNNRTLALKRKDRGLTQSMLAKKVRTSQRNIAGIEAGKRRPSPELAQRIADYFEMTIEETWEMFYSKKQDLKPANVGDFDDDEH